MAGGSIIGSLRVVLGLDSAALDKGLKESQSAFSKFGRDMLAIAGGIKLEKLLTSAIDSFTHAIKKSITQADEFGKAAQKVGMSVEDFSKLAYAAELSDISVETLTASMVKLDKNFAAVAAGAKGPVSQALDAMGLRAGVVNGTIKTQQDLLFAVADKFASYADGANKSRLAVTLFDKAGAGMIPLLNGGSAALREAAEEATRFGIVISKQMAADSQEFGDNLKRLGKITDGLVMQFTWFMLPALEQFSKELVATAGDGDVMKVAAQTITKALTFVAMEIAEVTMRIRNLGAEWAAFKNFMEADFLAGELPAAWEAWNKVGADLEERIKKMRETYKSFSDAVASQDPWAQQMRSYQRMSNELSRLMAGYEGLKKEAPAFSDAAEKSAEEAEKALKKLFEAGQKTFEDTRTATEAFQMEMEKLTRQYEAGAISATTYARAVQQIQFPSLTKAIDDAGNLNKQLDSFSTGSLNATSSALADIVTGTKTAKEAFADLAKAVIRDLAEMIIKAILFKTIVTPLLGGMSGGLGSFLGFSQGGSMGFGMAGGGSFMVPGGSSMTDNQMVPLNLASGERVTVDRPGSSENEARVVNVNLPKGDGFSRRYITGMVAALNDAIGDNVKLQLAPASR